MLQAIAGQQLDRGQSASDKLLRNLKLDSWQDWMLLPGFAQKTAASLHASWHVCYDAKLWEVGDFKIFDITSTGRKAARIEVRCLTACTDRFDFVLVKALRGKASSATFFLDKELRRQIVAKVLDVSQHAQVPTLIAGDLGMGQSALAQYMLSYDHENASPMADVIQSYVNKPRMFRCCSTLPASTKAKCWMLRSQSEC
jgi:hypothetical protein